MSNPIEDTEEILTFAVVVAVVAILAYAGIELYKALKELFPDEPANRTDPGKVKPGSAQAGTVQDKIVNAVLKKVDEAFGTSFASDDTNGVSEGEPSPPAPPSWLGQWQTEDVPMDPATSIKTLDNGDTVTTYSDGSTAVSGGW